MRRLSTAVATVPQALSFIQKAAQHGTQSLLGPFHYRAGRFDQAFSSLVVEKLQPDLVVCSLVIDERTANSYGTLHGGAIASLVDIVGTLALLAQDASKGGVTVELSTSYCSSAKLGSRVTIHGKTLKLGKSLGFTQVDVFSEAGALIASGRHTKAFGQPAP